MRTIDTITIKITLSEAEWKTISDAGLDHLCEACDDAKEEIGDFVRALFTSKVDESISIMPTVEIDD